MRGSARWGAAAAAALLTATGLTACSGDGEEPTPTAWAAADATNSSDKEGEKADAADYKVVPGKAWDDLALPEGGTSAMVDPQTWPDVQTLLTAEQIKGFIPTKNLGQPEYCAYGSYDDSDAGQTPKNAQCSWDLDDGNRLRLTLRGIGADSEVVRAWDGVRTKFRDEKNSEDSFYRDGTYGARRVLLRRDGLGSFVISNGEIAAWFDVRFPDDDFLVNDNPPETFKAVQTKAFPTMVETFVPFLPRKQ